MLPGALGLEAKQFADTESGFGATKVVRRDAVAREIFFGEVDTPKFVVFVDITNDVGELKGEAQLFGEIEGPRVREADNK